MSRSTRIRAAIVLAVWVALATFPEWSVAWESSRFAAGIIRQILIFAIFASSLNLLVGYAGLPSLGHAAFFGGGAYAAAIVAQRLGTDELLVSLGAAVAGAALLALVVGYLAVRAVGIFFLMLTLALAQMVFAIAFQATDLTGGSNGFSGVHRPVLLGIDFNAANDLYLLVCAVALLVALLLWRLATSSYGRALVGVRENERRMRALGYDTRTLKLSAFVLAGALAGVAGALSAYEFRFVSPNDVALGTSVAGFVMVLIGGAGTLVGPIVGAAVVLSIERVLPSQLPAQMVLGIVFIAFVVFARQGLVGAVRRAVRA
ncbi:MAG TPA: branched-chain amino acid ABC transporter permease [Candidatus Saccharimonadales bacterium]|jgi:branched-chain amino acid transport system permease protein|nr:branched-chain amino acid ABC transporter permease [Candidatus Saccharimonadales bacterium]